jgi:alanine dehydrogenase
MSKSPFAKGEFLPQEETLEVQRSKKSLYIGIPKEQTFQENRVSIVPEAVQLLVSHGHEVVVESGAGVQAHFSDQRYSEVGAKIVYDVKEVYKADIIMKVEPPTLEELDMMQERQTLISALQITTQKKSYLEKLMQKKITALAFEYMQDEGGVAVLMRSMSEIAGNTSILIAAEHLSKAHAGKGMMLGGVTGVRPTEVLILGAGTVGEFAARSAMGLGASVKVFDNSLYKLRRLQNDVQSRLYTSVIQPKVLSKAVRRADVIIGALRSSDRRTPCVVTEEMVSSMKEGSVIVDVSIDQGGCVETSEVTNHAKPVFLKHGVIHYCVPNIASRVSSTASFALSNILTPTLLRIADEGGLENVLRRDAGLRHGVYLCRGILSNRMVGDWFDMPHKDIDLLIASI